MILLLSGWYHDRNLVTEVGSSSECADHRFALRSPSQNTVLSRHSVKSAAGSPRLFSKASGTNTRFLICRGSGRESRAWAETFAYSPRPPRSSPPWLRVAIWDWSIKIGRNGGIAIFQDKKRRISCCSGCAKLTPVAIEADRMESAETRYIVPKGKTLSCGGPENDGRKNPKKNYYSAENTMCKLKPWKSK